MTSSAHATPRRREGHPREMVDVAWRLKRRPPERHSRSRSARAEVPPRPGGPRSRPRGRSRLLRADARTPGKLKSDSAAGAGSPVEGRRRRRRRRRRGPTPPPGGSGPRSPSEGAPTRARRGGSPPPPGRAHLLPPPTRRPPSGPTPLASEPVGGWDGEDRAGDGLTLSGS